MRITRSFAVWTLVLLSATPPLALAQSRFRPDDGKAMAYRAGYSDGYRDGMRQGSFDFREHRRYNYRTREFNRADRYVQRGFRYRGDYRRGYKEGYRAGYDSSYFRNDRYRRWRY